MAGNMASACVLWFLPSGLFPSSPLVEWGYGLPYRALLRVKRALSTVDTKKKKNHLAILKLHWEAYLPLHFQAQL